MRISPFRRFGSFLLPTVLVTVSALASLLASGGAPATAADPDPALVGSWTTPVDIGVVGVHAVLLHSGKVLFDFWGHDGQGTNDGTGSVAKVWNPKTGGIKDASIPFAYNAFCGGHTVLPDGRVFFAGGNEYGTTTRNGTSQTGIFNPATMAWTPGPELGYARWYPSIVELRDGTSLILSGQALTSGPTIEQVERYDPASNTISELPPSADRSLQLYPRTMLLPNGNVFMAGPSSLTLELDTKAWSWTTVGSMIAENRFGGAAVLLPGLRKVLALGGEDPGSGHATDTAEIIDTSAANPQWRATNPMVHERLFMNPVLLPDGNVLVVGGGYQRPFTGPEKSAELFDPQTETWTEMASQTASRIYHSTALLLPDGRVVSAGQNDGPLQTTLEVYSPPYLFRGPRPTISSAPASLTRGASFTIGTPDAGDISRVALIRPGSVTHSVNFDQRYVRLKFTKGAGELTASVPTKAAVTPPGWYMLFITNSEGVPAEARMVRIR